METSPHIEFAQATFGLQPTESSAPPACRLPLPKPGNCLAVVGPSGAGKTLALRALQGCEVVPLSSAELGSRVLALFDPRLPSEQVLRSLARVGLADGRMWSLQARHLSAGERRRLEFALCLCGGYGLIVADEFDAHLDATTACVLAENLRRLVERDGLQLVVSTHRPETLAYLQPQRVVEIDRGEAIQGRVPPARSVLDEIEIVPGRLRDYTPFAQWHYLGPGRPGPTSNVYLARHGGRPVGIAVFGYPHLLLSARAAALPDFSPVRVSSAGAKDMNGRLRLLQRVVVEPRFRGVGIAQALIRHGLADVGVDYVECIAQMGRFSDFLLASGFRKIGRMEPPASARRLSAFLRTHGIQPASLLDGASRAEQRARLPAGQRKRLDVLLRRLVATRIQTGFGSRRGGPATPDEEILRKALTRLEARPAYFLWTREAQ